jgi:hypothetical protein
MRLFGKKFTEDQEEELRNLLEVTTHTCAALGISFKQLQVALRGLYSLCSEALARGASAAAPHNAVEDARRSIGRYLSDIEVLTMAVEAVAPAADWYPERTVADYRSLIETLGRLRSVLSMIEESLQSPALDRQAGKDKLNMFVSGLNLLAVVQQGLRPPAR